MREIYLMNPQKIWHYAISYYRHGNATAYLKLDNAQYLCLILMYLYLNYKVKRAS